MLVMTLEKVPPSLRGELTRWLVEVQKGVYVGRVSALIRDLLWEKALAKRCGGKCVQVWKTNTEQGFDLRMSGDLKRKIVDIDGIRLIAVRNTAWEAMLEKGVFEKK